ncbi:protein FAR1-RELATED SEQUENCE 3-like [Cucumis melo var. makuwa]|uniref:Protein FAR1-RELATED SEQUENCE 3-like n=1 Tax=Cucumis melo var. makuwa TaxID=1194695 RepID=A0A5D3DG81_CUCMM|nr:protein FAR1-RELATED SEQUENCE 3-like [Cucumis melo var. makuwa]
MLPRFAYILELNNLRIFTIYIGSVVDYKVDIDGRFLYFFMALSASISGWQHSRPVISIGGTSLKNKYSGTLLSASTPDVNDQIFLLAFYVVDSENDSSWTWFCNQLKKIIGGRNEVVIVSDRHKSDHRQWQMPDNIIFMVILPPNVKRVFGRLKKIRIPSRMEFKRHHYKRRGYSRRTNTSAKMQRTSGKDIPTYKTTSRRTSGEMRRERLSRRRIGTASGKAFPTPNWYGVGKGRFSRRRLCRRIPRRRESLFSDVFFPT